MNKTTKTAVIVVAVVAVLAGGVAAFAADNTSDLENAWLAFRAELNKTLVADGTITQERADESLDNLTERFAASAEDEGLARFGKRAHRHGGIVAEYATLVDKDVAKVVDMLKEDELTIWQLAEQDGKFEELKALVLADMDERIADFSGDDARLELLKTHRDEIAAMTSAKDAPKRAEGLQDGYRRGEKGGMGQGFFGRQGNGQNANN